jgi:hypothetical protein
VQSVSTNQTTAGSTLSQNGVAPTGAGQVMVAFLASDGPGTAGGQSFPAVTGCGATWTLVQRANAQPGDAEIWQATSAGATTCTVSATRASGSYQGSITVATYSGGSVGVNAGASGSTGAAAVTLTGVSPLSGARGVGSDYTSATGRTLLAGQSMVNQMLASTGDTYWVQKLTDTSNTPSTLPFGTSAPSGSRKWNFAAVEIKGADNAPPPVAACGDGLDNDNDGKIDFPADPGCVDANDNDETDAPPPPPAACADTIDNDGDGKIDFPADPGCASATDTDETDPPPGVPPVGSYVQPHTVGFLGDPATLTRLQPGGAVAAGCSWQSYGMRCDQHDLTLDHVWLTGGLYWTGTGNLTVTNSIAEGSLAWYDLYAAATTHDAGSKITVADSTLRWAPGVTYPCCSDVGNVWDRSGFPQLLTRNDISGMPQGDDPSGGSEIRNNWIHDLVQNNPGSSPTHLDGIFSQGGSNGLIQGNYVDAPVRTDVTAGVFFQDRTQTDTGWKVWGNYIVGGAYYNLRNETSIGLDVQNNSFGNNNLSWNQAPGTIGVWAGNVRPDGSPAPSP